MLEEIRALLYPLGLLATFLFSFRFLWQWIQSEKKRESHVTALFWIISCAGNAVMALHGVIQGQFPLALLQATGFAIAWRNLHLMKEAPTPLSRFLPKMTLPVIAVLLLFALQALFLHSFDWMRAPRMPWSTHQAEQASFAWHLIGFFGMTLFASRFWIQWWRAEKNHLSSLERSFWLLSVSGSLLSLLYFIRLADVVNIAGYGVGLLPYLRNLMLLKKVEKRPLSDKIFLFAGEQSGDHLGEGIVSCLKREGLSLYGVGGERMKKAGLALFLPMEAFQVMGFSAVLKAIFRLFSLFRTIRKEILTTLPQAVILIDYPDFNLRLAASLRKGGYSGKIIHYVSPSVWAWRQGRIKTLAKHHDLLLTILPFEKECYAHTSLPVEYVGHPLVRRVKEHILSSDWKKECGIPAGRKVIALFPGSRDHEIAHNLPLQLKAASEALAHDPTLFVAISCARDSLENAIRSHLKDAPHAIVPSHFTYELMQGSFVAIATSGTVTLELALHKLPTLVTYRMPLLNYILGRYLFRIILPHYSLPNIIAKEEIFPEFVHRKISTRQLHSALSNLLKERETKSARCKRVIEECGELDASAKAAAAILNLIK